MINTFFSALALVIGLLLTGCASKPAQPVLYDLGPLPEARVVPGLPALSMAQTASPLWLDTPAMFFRLSYAGEQQPRAYTRSRWIMPPAQLLSNRLKARIGQAGGAVFSASTGAANVPMLRLELDDFTQTFSTPQQSHVDIALRAALFDGRKLLAQKSFTLRRPTPSPDAEGAAQALAHASDRVITDLITWLASATASAK